MIQVLQTVWIHPRKHYVVPPEFMDALRNLPPSGIGFISTETYVPAVDAEGGPIWRDGALAYVYKRGPKAVIAARYIQAVEWIERAVVDEEGV